MSDKTLIDVADAFTARLAELSTANVFTPLTFTPERSYATFDDLVTVAQGLRVDVVPISFTESGLASRDRIGYVCAIDTYVRKRFNDVSDRQASAKNQIKRDEIDKLVQLVQQIHNRTIRLRLPTMPSAAWKTGVITFPYSRKHLRENQMFFGAVRLTYSASEGVPT